MQSKYTECIHSCVITLLFIHTALVLQGMFSLIHQSLCMYEKKIMQIVAPGFLVDVNLTSDYLGVFWMHFLFFIFSEGKQ